MNYKLLLFLFSQLVIGCAHYFSSSYDVDNDLKRSSKSGFTICVIDDWNSGNVVKSEQDQSWSNKENIYIVRKLTQNFPKFEFKCQKTNDLVIKYSKIQTRGSFEASFVSLGIVPAVLPTKYSVAVFDGENKLIFKSQNKGYAVGHFLFIPFFFLHKSNEEIIYEEIAKYLQEVAEN